MISRPQRLRQTAADLEDKALQCEGIHCDDEQRSNGSPAPAVLTLAESEISQHHARSERNGDFTSPTSLVTRSKTLFGANSRLAAGQIPKCVGLDLPLRRINAIAAEDGGAQSPDCWLAPNTALSAPSSILFAYKWKPELNERSFSSGSPNSSGNWRCWLQSAAPRRASSILSPLAGRAPPRNTHRRGTGRRDPSRSTAAGSGGLSFLGLTT